MPLPPRVTLLAPLLACTPPAHSDLTIASTHPDLTTTQPDSSTGETTSTSAAADRILHSKGRYTLVNGLVVAADWDALTSGSIDHPINVTEKSETSIGSYVWTGTPPERTASLRIHFLQRLG